MGKIVAFLLIATTCVADSFTEEGRLRSVVYPVLSKRVTSDFGKRLHPLMKVVKHHNGVDIASPIGTEVRAVYSGIVVFTERLLILGNTVVVYHGQGLTTHYGHLSKIVTSAGAAVEAGELIAQSGNSGRSTGPHLHFELRRDGVPQDPRFVIPHINEIARG